MINSLGYGHMCNNWECVGEVIYGIAIADEKFDGRGHRYGFRCRYGYYYLKNYLRRESRYSRDTLSLDAEYSLGKPIKDFLTSSEEENFEQLIDVNILSSREKDILTMYYVNNFNYREIGEKYNFTRQRAEQIVKAAIEKLKGVL